MSSSASAVQAWRRYDADELRLSAPISTRMLDLARLRAGAQVLDIATGRGEPAVRAAHRVAPDGFVLGTDVAGDMLAFASARAAAESVRNLGLVVTDGQSLAGIPVQHFDAALCRWGLMFFERPIEALQAIRQRLRPGGVLVAALWSAPATVSWWSMPRDVLARHAELPRTEPDAPGPFRYATSASFRAHLAAAGFSFVHEEEHHTAVMESTTPEGVIDWCLAFGLSRLLGDLPEAVGAAWRRDMLRAAEQHRDADGRYRLGGITRLVLAQAA